MVQHGQGTNLSNGDKYVDYGKDGNAPQGTITFTMEINT